MKVKVFGTMKVEPNSTIALIGVINDVTVTTDNDTKKAFADGWIVEGYATYKAVSADENDTKRYLFVGVGQNGAKITRPDNSTETVPGGTVIRVNSDGSLQIVEDGDGKCDDPDVTAPSDGVSGCGNTGVGTIAALAFAALTASLIARRRIAAHIGSCKTY